MSAPRGRAVVVVAYGDPSLLHYALEPLDDELVVVVDNSSNPVTRDFVSGLGHTYLDPGANLGFAAGVNVGLAHVATAAPGSDVLLLNPDAQIRPAALDGVQAALLAEPDLAAVSPTVTGPDGLRHITQYPLPSLAQTWRFALGIPQPRGTRNFLMGACLLLRAEAIADVGPFDERYFLYGEESDWQRRSFLKGWRVAEVETQTASHLVGGSSDDSAVRLARIAAGRDVHIRRWYGARASVHFRVAGWVGMAIRTGSWPDARANRYIFRVGPRRVAPLPPAPRPLLILHVATTTSADLEELVSAQRGRGDRVTVAIGARAARQALLADDPWDVVHAHDRRALALARATGARHGARLAADAEVLTRRGARFVAGRRVDLIIPAGADAAGYRGVQ